MRFHHQLMHQPGGACSSAGTASQTPQTMCTTIVHFLVFLKRFSPRHRASARCCSRLAKRRQPPSRRSRCILQHMEFIICKQILLKIGGPAARHIGVLWCLFVVPYQSFWLRLGPLHVFRGNCVNARLRNAQSSLIEPLKSPSP